MKRVYDFLRNIAENNNREWFNSHKVEYEEAKTIFSMLVRDVIDRISGWDRDIADSNLTVKDVSYRFYRDIRFSKDKSPYKRHFGAYICKGGKKSPYAGYYLHIEPRSRRDDGAEAGSGLMGQSILAAGVHCPGREVLSSLKDEISVNGDSFLDAIAQAGGFELDYGNAMKRLPAGFDNVEARWHDLLKLRDFDLFMPIEESTIFSPGFADYICSNFRKCAEFNRIINLAVDFAIEQM